MRRTWAGIPALVALLTALGGNGCYSTNYAKINKPKRDEVFNLPAVADSRWDKPLEYPKGTLNRDSIVKQKDKDSMPPPSMRGSGAGGPRTGSGMGAGAPGGY